MRGLASSIFVVLILGWAIVDPTSLLNVAGTFVQVFMVAMKKLASAASEAVNQAVIVLPGSR